METRKTKLALTASALAFALMLAGCGGGGGSSSAVTPSGGGGTNPPVVDDEPTGPVAVMMDMMLPAGLMPDDVDLPNSNDTVTVDIDKGETVTLGANEDGQGGVEFMCDSDYACSLTLTNKAGTLVAEYSTKKKDADADNPMVTAMVIEIPEPTPPPMEVAGSISLTDEAKTWLLANVGGDRLDTNGEEIEINLASGETKMYGSDAVGGMVSITCDSAYPCTVTLRNVLGELEATMVTMQDADADAPTIMAAFTPPPRDPLVVGGAKRADGDAVHGAIMQSDLIVTFTDFNAANVGSGGTAPTAQVTVDVNKLQHPGTFELQGDFVEIQTEPTPSAADDDPIIKSTQVDEDGGPELNAAGLNIAAADLATWRVHSLERDWAHRLPDEPEDAPLYGGFVTNALVGENIGGNKTRAFDDLFTLTGDDELENLLGNPSSNGGLAMFTYDGQANTYQNNKGANEDFRGSFADVSGVYRCAATCWLVKDREKGTVSVMADDSNAPDATNFAALEFVPDDKKAMASVPDWAWMTFGAWLTTPNDDAGQHSIGLIATSGGWADMLPETEYYAELEGEATYKGLALGYYVDDTETGTFTATATLNVDFDATADHISGTVSNFHDANGEAMNEFVVNLDAADLSGTGSADATAVTSGHANGIDWSGRWAAQLGGAPDANVEGVSFTGGEASANIKDLSADGVTVSAADHPLGATGRFDAFNTASAVTGAFGADLQQPKDN